MRSITKFCVFLICLGLAGQKAGVRDLKVDTATPAKVPMELPNRSNLWAVVVGVSKYKNLPERGQLKYAHRDAEAFASFLQSPQGGGFNPGQVKVLTNEKATLAALRTAIGTWLPRSAEQNDIVYLFFAGHGTIDAGDKEGYLLAHDSDPQNLYATAFGFRELDRLVSDRIRAHSVVMIADACHAAQIGWNSRSTEPQMVVNRYLEEIGKTGKSVLRILSARADERSYEDERWGGGHGAFTYHLLEGLRGKAEKDKDGVVRASELIDYLSTIVPEETQALQHPRVAGSFETRLPLGVLAAGPAEPPFVRKPVAPGLAAQIDEKLRARQILEAGGAWDLFQKFVYSQPESTDRVRIQAELTEALEELGQAGINDYVQSSSPGLKRDLMVRSAEAYKRLRLLRPYDEQALEAKQLFAEGRARLMEGKPQDAIPLLERSIQLDPKSACPYSALGAAFEKTQQPDKALAAWREAIKITPEWAVPRALMAVVLLQKGDRNGAIQELEQAVKMYPNAYANRWMLTRLYRSGGQFQEAHRVAADLVNANPNYAPIYIELGQIYEQTGNRDAAAQAYDAYVQIAPNFSDSLEVRGKAMKLRNPAQQTPVQAPAPQPAAPPSLKKGKKK